MYICTNTLCSIREVESRWQTEFHRAKNRSDLCKGTSHYAVPRKKLGEVSTHI
jgi:hypothetical protein